MKRQTKRVIAGIVSYAVTFTALFGSVPSVQARAEEVNMTTQTETAIEEVSSRK